MNRQFLTPTEAASLYGLTAHILRSEIDAGRLPALRLVSGRLLVNPADLQVWLTTYQTSRVVVPGDISLSPEVLL